MPAAVHAPLITPTGFIFKEKSGEPLVPAFTAVNGRTSPLSPRRPSGMSSMATDSLHILTRTTPPEQPPQEPKGPLPDRDDWHPAPPAAAAASDSARHRPASPTASPASPPTTNIKRKRSSSPEASPPSTSPDRPTTTRSRLDSFPPLRQDVSPPAVSSVYHLVNEHPHPRTLPPIETSDPDLNWPASSHNAQHSRFETQRHESHRDPAAPMYPSSHSDSHGTGLEGPNGSERSTTTEMTRAGVQVDPKKRKRQFANRTKTGCGTCRRRKKKCDEAKPECNNCQRGGFICEGYANKIPWPKNGPQKPPPLQAKDRFPPEHSQLYHSHGTAREPYGDPNSQSAVDGGRGRPIVVEEHNPQPPTSRWGPDWSEPPRTSYPSDQQTHPQHSRPPLEYSQPLPVSSHSQSRPSDQQHSPPSQTLPPPRQHNPRIYHHTPQTMSQVVNHSPAVTAEAPSHHPPQPLPPQPHHSHPPAIASLTAAPPGPPPNHYAPPPPSRSHKSEKEKMLNGEPFMPFAPQLVEERDKCKSAVYRFNNTDNPQKEIARETRDNIFRAILAARWTIPYSEPGKPPPCGHLGREGVYIDSPFMCEYGYNLSIGDNVDIGTSCKFLDSGRISIGRNSSIGANVTIDTQRTPGDCKVIKGSRRTAIAAEVHIGENVHIGSNCTILAGVRIGAGAIVHPGSVVVRDIPQNCVARGNPADYV
ncbi:unnamed protein product [Periconia digitata]|uniref:Zn(2)-C6 fungal-type domain-containing protein n=1 Tax=Periconia digitata TaxID=1303443 RepID=A0A9W4UQX8_9PLEO|nr:unnamed protein product [Periconia digitata]